MGLCSREMNSLILYLLFLVLDERLYILASLVFCVLSCCVFCLGLDHLVSLVLVGRTTDSLHCIALLHLISSRSSNTFLLFT